jgi:hypothetical protein
MAMRWLVCVLNDQIRGSDSLTVMSHGLRSGRAIALGVEHQHDMGTLCRLPERFIAMLIGSEVAAQIVVGLAALRGEREAVGAGQVWRAVGRGELPAVSTRLQRMTEREGVVVAAEIAEVSLVRTGACLTCRVVAVGEGPMDVAAVSRGLRDWSAWRSRNVQEVKG